MSGTSGFHYLCHQPFFQAQEGRSHGLAQILVRDVTLASHPFEKKEHSGFAALAGTVRLPSDVPAGRRGQDRARISERLSTGFWPNPGAWERLRHLVD